MHYTRDFDICLARGQEGESIVFDTLACSGAQQLLIEVKTDEACHQTGNIFIEIMYKGQPSGIATTKSEYYALLSREKKGGVLVRTELLKLLCQKHNDHLVKGGDHNRSWGILIPTHELMTIILGDV